MINTGHTKRGQVLRVSVTERCNLHCRYCRPLGAEKAPPLHALPLDRLLDLILWLHQRRPLRKLKLTGGEPLLRRGLVPWIAELHSFGLAEISMTTNGALLAAHAQNLASAGLARVNVSLDTLDSDRFHKLSGGKLAATLAGIDAALDANLTPLKLNAVLRQSSWREDVPALLDFAAERGLEIRFIELMRTGKTAAWAENEFVSADVVREWLSAQGRLRHRPHRIGEPARLADLDWRGNTVRTGWITPYSYSFCEGCDRLRLDCAGNLHRCLMDKLPFPLDSLLNSEHTDEADTRLAAYLAGKQPPDSQQTARSMTALGG